MVDAVLEHGVAPDGSIYLERKDGVLDKSRYSWTQAEAVIGFLNAYEFTGEQRYLNAAMKNWRYIQTDLIDKVDGGWFFAVNEAGEPLKTCNKVGPWEGPYHIARACMETVTRLDRLKSQWED